ncbi:MAG: amidohydrolase family protein [Planctomycetaceae bacterium]
MLNRREFVSQSGRAILATGVAAQAWTHLSSDRQLSAAEDDKDVTNNDKQPIIDTHQHLWDLKKFNLPWVKDPGLESMNRNYLMSDYLETTKGFNIAKTVYMEVDVHPSQQQKEADYVLALCDKEDNPMDGVVISGELHQKEFAPYIKTLAENSFVKGVRKVLHGSSTPPGHCLQPQFVEHVQLLGKLGLSFDLCMRPEEVIDTVKLADKCPKTQFILDHLGNMGVASPDEKLRKNWEHAIQELAQRPHVACKISGVVATANEKWKPADLADLVNYCLDAFGSERVVFGGDWPVCMLRATLPEWILALREIVQDRSEEFRQKLWHDNAIKIYRLS